MYDPDLKLTKAFQMKMYIAVFLSRGKHSDIAFEYCLRRFKRYLCSNDKGYSQQPYFQIYEVSKECYDNPELIIACGNLEHNCEKIFIGPEKVEGFPDNFNYMKEWYF